MLDVTRSARGEAAIVMPLLGALVPPLAEREQQDMSFQFAHMMSVAGQHDILPLDLTGLPEDLTRANVPALGASAQSPDGRVEIAISLKNYPAPVTFRLEKSPHGKWRLRQIIPPGGDEKSIPFGLGHAN